MGDAHEQEIAAKVEKASFSKTICTNISGFRIFD